MRETGIIDEQNFQISGSSDHTQFCCGLQMQPVHRRLRGRIDLYRTGFGQRQSLHNLQKMSEFQIFISRKHFAHFCLAGQLPAKGQRFPLRVS